MQTQANRGTTQCRLLALSDNSDSCLARSLLEAQRTLVGNTPNGSVANDAVDGSSTGT
jgi:hypothetical protein